MTMIDIIMNLIRSKKPAEPEMLACMEGMAERNAERLQKIKDEMGEKWIMHRSHKKSRLQDPRPV